MTSLEQQGELQKTAAGHLFGALKGRDWKRAKLFFSQVGGSSHMWAEATDRGGNTFYFSYPRPLSQTLRDLKAAMSDPDKGAWLSATLELGSDGRFAFAYNWDRRVYWNDELDDPLQPPVGKPDPDDASYVEEFQRYPRSAAYLPEWVPGPPAPDHDQDRLDAIMATPAPLPADLEPLAGQSGWDDLFAGTEEEFGRRLATEPYRSMLDEVSRRDGDRVADGLLQDVTADVMATYVDPRPAADALRLWQELAAVRSLDEPPALDQLDLSAPLDGTEASVRIRADILAVLDDVVDAKIAARFP